ncbi:hypothetical protein BJ508DRAFT_347418 [Ascobolus immersus RN42]|uniref:Uncharacterized protein n=1 Tax=Ascobolus immersus RN42 TaxID=1160509 RepID=A0A3N4I3U0_ASCIM|nr:hypothetical protein BJ508DRAFT_347418 [Ascobolus immersus RN42]
MSHIPRSASVPLLFGRSSRSRHADTPCDASFNDENDLSRCTTTIPQRRHTNDNPSRPALTPRPSRLNLAASPTIKRRRLASALGGTEKVYLNGPVYSAEKRCQDCWRAIKGIDMELEDIEIRYAHMVRTGSSREEFQKVEVEFARLRTERKSLQAEHKELLRKYEEERRRVDRLLSWKEKGRKMVKNVWRIVVGKKG